MAQRILRAGATSLLLCLVGAGQAAEAKTTTSHGDRVRVSLTADVGAGAYLSHRVFVESGCFLVCTGTTHEALWSATPILSGAVSVTWRAGLSRVGVRAQGYFGRLHGERSASFDRGGSASDELDATLAGGTLGVVAERGGLWAASGFGLLHLHDDSWDAEGRGEYQRHVGEDRHTYFTPELHFSAGYRLQLTRFLALKLSAELGGFPFWNLHLRGVVQGGVQLRI